MAWPSTRYQSMSDGFPPTWNAAFGNALQDAINGLYAGTGLLTGTFSGVATPTPAFTKNVLYKEGVPIAMAYVQNGGAITFVWGVNIASVTRTSAGIVVVNLGVGAAAAADLLPQVTSRSASVGAAASATGAAQITVASDNLNGTLASADTDFFLTVYSRT